MITNIIKNGKNGFFCEQILNENEVRILRKLGIYCEPSETDGSYIVGAFQLKTLLKDN